jgi:hypothetical protein
MRKRNEVEAKIGSNEHAEKLGKELQATLEGKAKVEFPSANAATEKNMAPGFERIIEHVFIVDIWETYEKLESRLRIGDERKDYGRVIKELDDAESNARLAHRLWTTALVAREEFEQNNEVIFAAMRQQATMELQDEKEAGKRNKTITDADVVSRCALNWPDEFGAQELKKKKVKAMEKSMEDLANKWDSRCRSLATIATKLR